MMRITGDTIIGDILDLDSSIQEVFQAFDMHCMQCPASRGETVEEACEIHGVDLGELLGRLQSHLGGAGR